jgi:hypothetical protein
VIFDVCFIICLFGSNFDSKIDMVSLLDVTSICPSLDATVFNWVT